jgi:hypothetical protein
MRARSSKEQNTAWVRYGAERDAATREHRKRFVEIAGSRMNNQAGFAKARSWGPPRHASNRDSDARDCPDAAGIAGGASNSWPGRAAGLHSENKGVKA